MLDVTTFAVALDRTVWNVVRFEFVCDAIAAMQTLLQTGATNRCYAAPSISLTAGAVLYKH